MEKHYVSFEIDGGTKTALYCVTTEVISSPSIMRSYYSSVVGEKEEKTFAGQIWCCVGVMPFYEYEHIPSIYWLDKIISK